MPDIPSAKRTSTFDEVADFTIPVTGIPGEVADFSIPDAEQIKPVVSPRLLEPVKPAMDLSQVD